MGRSLALAALAAALLAGTLALVGNGSAPGAPPAAPMPTPSPCSARQTAEPAAAQRAVRQESAAHGDAARCGRELRGRVVGGDGGPLADVAVALVERGTPSVAVLRTATDRRGEFGFALTARTLGVTLVASAPGRAPAVVDHVLPPATSDAGAAVEVDDLALPAGGCVEGDVVEATAAPCTEATVRLLPVSGPLLRLPAELAGALARERAVDARGHYAFEDLPAGAYELVADAPWRTRARSPRIAVVAGGRALQPPLVLAPGHVLRGIVLGPDGAPMPGAHVDVLATGDVTTPQLARRVLTAADGTFAVEHLAAGGHHLRAWVPGLPPAILRDLDPSAAPALVAQLDAGRTVHGRVAGAARGALVRLVLLPPEGSAEAGATALRRLRLAREPFAGVEAGARWPRTVAVDGERRFVFAAVPPGRYGVEVAEPRGTPVRVADVEVGARSADEIEIELRRR